MGRAVMTELSCVLRSVSGRARKGWEAIRVDRFYGLQALARLTVPGTVAIDPAEPGVYFFVPAGATAAWPKAPAGGISVLTDLYLPPARRQTPPGIYWLVPPRRGAVRLITGDSLLAALTEVIPDWSEAAS